MAGRREGFFGRVGEGSGSWRRIPVTTFTSADATLVEDMVVGGGARLQG